MNLIDIIIKNARFYKDEIAFVEIRPLSKLRKSITWGEFSERVIRLGNALKARGVKKGDKIFIFGRNSIDWLIAYFGAMIPGSWAVPLNYRFTPDDILYCANVSEPVAFVMDEEFANMVYSLRSSLYSVKYYICIGSFEGMERIDDIIESSSSTSLKIDLRGEDECALYFTSGTTGAPKPVLHLHRNLVCVALNEVTNEKWEHSDCLLMLPPFYHLAIGHLFGCILAGGHAIFLTEKISPQYIFESISNEKVTLVFLLVPWALDILEALDQGRLIKEFYDLSSWRLVYMGAQPIPPKLVLRWKQYFPEMQFDNVYGLSESAGPGTLHLGIGNEGKIGSIGKPGLLWDVRIVDDNGNDVAIGEVGELIVKGPGIMKEYYKNPELTAQTIRDGWLYTGDLAKMDRDGFTYLVDRKKDLVISGGENIYPVEIEAVLQRHPKIRDVAVIGTPDDRLGEVVTAIIEPIAGEILKEEDLRPFIEENLPRYKRPRRIIFDHVPRSLTGKIEKPKLREKYYKKI